MIRAAITRLLSAHDLPETPPADPFPMLVTWLRDAVESGKYDDANAMALATATLDGLPSVRIVLCKAIEPDHGTLTFFTNYKSRKGRDLDANPRAAAVFHWPHASRQARVEGTVEQMPAHESDEYFRSRPLLSRIGATISPQSEVLESRSVLLDRAFNLIAQGMPPDGPNRPEWWGGYRLFASDVELWSGREGRFHQRVAWSRSGDQWHSRLLAP